MRALLLDRPGALETLRVGDVTLPEPGPGELRVRVHAVGLNPVDYKLARGRHPAWQYPFILGLDVAGVVDALGAGVVEWAVGDRVAYHGDLSRPGGLAEFAIVPAHVTARIPDSVSFVDAAALPCAGMTAYQALFRKTTIRPGQTVLVHAGAGGVGGYAIQLAANVGATVITTASQPNHDFVRSLGALHAIDYRSENAAVRVLELTNGRGVDLVVDTLGTESAAQALKLLAFNGHLLCVDDTPPASALSFDKAVSIHAIALGGAHGHRDLPQQRDLALMLTELLDLLAEGKLQSLVTQVVTLEQTAEALLALERRHVRGKIVTQIID
ncbi:MAG: zinc-binding dehydrogenase [Anaerolineae bacterium]|nr:zinc-binding dehydrogenase [Anaerolineae bacterium]